MESPTLLAPVPWLARPPAAFQRSPAWRAVVGDGALVAAALGAVFVLFYRCWPLWEDQAIYHYMAWGLQHGLRPYAETVNMNWPGIVLVHWAARLISGPNPFGLRLLDLAFQLLLAGTTSALLVHYRIARPLRLWCLVLFFTNYFLSGFESTAQRESFCLPLVSFGLVLALIAAEGPGRIRLALAFACGLAAGLGLWIKPVLGLPLATAWGVFLLRSPAPVPWRLTVVASLAGGALAATAGALLFLYCCCDPGGFWHWGVCYAFGPYASARWLVKVRLHHTFLNLAYCPGPTLLLAVGLAAYAAPCLRLRETPPGTARIRLGTVAGLLAVLLSIYVTIFVQGKTGCGYHYIPLHWAMTVIGIVLLATFLPADWAPGTYLLLCTCAAVTLWATLRLTDVQLPPTDGTQLARQLQTELADGDEVVIFGFSPTFLSELQRKTPLPFVDAWILYCGCSGQAEWEEPMATSLQAALAQPMVKYFIVQRGLGRWRLPGFERSAEEIVACHVSGADLAALGFQAARQVKMPGGTKYDIYRRQ